MSWQRLAGKLLASTTRHANWGSRRRKYKRPLRIEPLESRSLLSTLDYSTFLGGSLADQTFAVAMDGAGNAYVTGETAGAGFPVTAGALDTSFNGSTDAFVAKFDASGALVWATYLGGGGVDRGTALTLDSAGGIYLTGVTQSSNFPTTPGAFDTSYNGGEDTWVAKLNANGSALLFSTYLGGSDHDHSSGSGQGLAVDSAGNVYVTGDTRSSNYPTTAGAFDTSYNGGLDDGVVTVLNAAGSALVYSTFLGGSGSDRVNGIAFDSLGNACLFGITNSGNFPTVSPLQASFAGGEFDAFVAKLNPIGSALLNSTYHGGSDADFASDIAVDAANNLYLLGGTRGSLPTTPGAFQTSKPGGEDAYVFSLNASGSTRRWATYLGGSGTEFASALALDASGNVIVSGGTSSTNLPRANAFQTTYGGGSRDGFVTKLNGTGTTLLFSSYVGGAALDHIYSMALDNADQPVVVGYTESSYFPTTPGAFDASFDGVSDAFLTKICLDPVIFSSLDDFSNSINTETSTWSYRSSTDTVRDGSYNLLTTNNFLVPYNPPTPTWNPGNASVFIGVNDSGGPVTSVASNYSWPDSTVLMSPPGGGFAVVSWLSSFTGTVDLQFSFRDIQPAGGGDGVRYYVDRNDSSGLLATAFLPDTGSTGLLAINNVAVTSGDRINFIVDSLGNTNNDTIVLTATITHCNRPPTAIAGGPYPVLEGGSVMLLGSGSDPDGDSLTYAWDLDNNGSFETPGQNVVFSAVGRDGPGAQPVVLRVTDTHGASATSPATISIGNVVPSIAISGNANVDEGSIYNLTLGAVSDPGTDTVTSYVVHWGDGYTDTYGTNGVQTHTYADGPNIYSIAVDLIDEDGTFLNSANPLTVAVNNVDPTATANDYTTSQATAVSGNVLTDGIADSDPAGANDPLSVISNTDPANGTLSLLSSGSFTYTPDTTFSGDDSFEYTISDGDGGTATATVTIHVSPAAPGSILIVPDSCLGGTALLITGTGLSDTVVVEPGTTAATLKVTLNGMATTATKPSGRLIVTGGDGDDLIQIASAVMNQAWLYGDTGHDRLNAGNGGSLLIGGDGNDHLLGGGGRDIMIGGEGADRLIGNASDDILIAGYTTMDNRGTFGHEEFWCLVLAEWNSSGANFSTRVNRLRSGTGSTGVNLLDQVRDDVFADDIDFLNGSAGEDWLIFLAGEDRISGIAEQSN